jgi:hypothetical protein
LPFDLIDEYEVQLEQPAHEGDDDQEVFLAVGEQVCRAGGVLEPGNSC